MKTIKILKKIWNASSLKIHTSLIHNNECNCPAIAVLLRPRPTSVCSTCPGCRGECPLRVLLFSFIHGILASHTHKLCLPGLCRVTWFLRDRRVNDRVLKTCESIQNDRVTVREVDRVTLGRFDVSPKFLGFPDHHPTQPWCLHTVPLFLDVNMPMLSDFVAVQTDPKRDMYVIGRSSFVWAR